MIFFNYCFYRVAMAYKTWISEGSEDYANAVVSLCQSANILSLIAIPYIINNSRYSGTLIIIISMIILIVNWIFFQNRKKYIEYSEKWENENPKYRKLKGFLVLLYIILSIVLVVIAFALMMRVPLNN